MSDDFDFDAFLNDIKNEMDADTGRRAQAARPAPEPAPRTRQRASAATQTAPARSRQARPAESRRSAPAAARTGSQPAAPTARAKRQQTPPVRRTAQRPKARKSVSIGTIIAWLFAITCLGGVIATIPSFSCVLLILAVLVIAPISPLRRAMERSRIRSWVIWALTFVLFIGGALSSPSEKTETLEQGTPVSRSMPEATVEPTITAEPTATPLPTDTPEPTAVPTPTPERVRGRYADTEVYISNSNGIVHSRSNCSGMKYYWTTTIKAANDAGYEFCEKCW